MVFIETQSATGKLVKQMIIRFYAALLRLYPRQFRAQFGDEMMTVFVQAIEDNNRTGKAFRFFLRELRDLPLNLARAHWRSKINKEFSMTIIKKPGLGFYPTWIFVMTLSVPIAFFLNFAILRIIMNLIGDYIYVDRVSHPTEDYLGLYTFIPIMGLIMGLLQYWLLRRYLPRMGWWVLATVGGWVIGLLLIFISSWLQIWSIESFDLDLAFIVMGLSIGTGQWLLLRRRLSRSGWWVGANIVGWGLLSLLTPGNSIGQYGLLLLGFLPACVTAMVLVLLIRPTPPTELQNR